MKTIDRYIVVHWLQAFGLALLATMGALLMEDLSDDLPDLLDVNIGAFDIIRYYLVLLPSFLPTVLPITILLSVLLSLGALHQKNQITALRASGFSLWQITRSIWMGGIVLAICFFFLNVQWVPWSVETARKIFESYEFKHQLKEKPAEEVGIINNLTFSNVKGRRLWFIGRFNEMTHEAYELSIYQKDSNDRITAHYSANEAFFEESAQHWVLKQGRFTQFSSEEEQLFSLPFDDLEKEIKSLKSLLKEQPYSSNERARTQSKLARVISIWQEVKTFNEAPRLMRALKKEPKDLSLLELQGILEVFVKEDDKRLNEYATRYHSLLATPFSCLIVIAIAVPFSVTGVRMNTMVKAAKALLLFLFYFLLANVGIFLSQSGAVSPIIAAWLPNSLMLVLAFFFYRKAA